MDKNKYINRGERIGSFFYVLVLFCAGAGLSSWWLLSRHDTSSVFTRKNAVVAKMERQTEFRQAQKQYAGVCDSLVRQIVRHNMEVNAVYEENDIRHLISEVRRQYENYQPDRRYMAFYHLGSIYEMWFTDKKQLWSKKENIELFRKNLEECELGLEKKKEELKESSSR
jgi:hypothetical protein